MALGSQQVWSPAPEPNSEPQPRHTIAKLAKSSSTGATKDQPGLTSCTPVTQQTLVCSSCDQPLVHVIQLLNLGQSSRGTFPEDFPLLLLQLLVFAPPKFLGVGTVPSLRLSVFQHPKQSDL